MGFYGFYPLSLSVTRISAKKPLFSNTGSLSPGLYLVSTPIGNLEDITFRALRVLREADVILAEDTRRTKILLTHYQISHRLVSYHDHNEMVLAPRVVEWVREGKSVALVTDAGTPTIADPGFRAVKAIIEARLPLYSIPGPSALTAALSLSGLPVHRFVFERYLPPRKGRSSRLEALASEERTIVLFESPHRLLKTLDDLTKHLGSDRPAAVLRELTKVHEEVIRGTLKELHKHFTTFTPRGELVIVVQGLGGGEK